MCISTIVIIFSNLKTQCGLETRGEQMTETQEQQLLAASVRSQFPKCLISFWCPIPFGRLRTLIEAASASVAVVLGWSGSRVRRPDVETVLQTDLLRSCVS